MTDDLEGDIITEFLSGGAKNYGYRTRDGKVECKVHGFTLNHLGASILNFDSMEQNILSELDDPKDKTSFSQDHKPLPFRSRHNYQEH